MRNMTIIPEELQIHEPDEKLLDIINSKIFNDRVLYEKQSVFHSVKVVENETGRFIHYKDTYQAGNIKTQYYTGNLPYINYFTIPFLMNKKTENVMLIGFGTGRLVNDLNKLYSGLKSIDVIDIEENIEYIAENFFEYEKSDNTNFYLQDGIVYLRKCKKKYDLIITDVASDDGIDERFLSDEYFSLINRHLSNNGIFVSNLCASPDFENNKNHFIRELKNIYTKHFQKTFVFKGNTSDKVYYKCFFGLDKRVIDVTNVILISTNNLNVEISNSKIENYRTIKLDISPYLQDLTEIWQKNL